MHRQIPAKALCQVVGNSQEMQHEQLGTSDTGIYFTQAFTQMEPDIATVLGNMKQWSAFNRQSADPRVLWGLHF